MKRVTIYTDGACSGNPGPGGWAAVMIYMSARKEISGCEPMTTNNRMELTAAIEGLQALKEPCAVDIYTDSSYLYNAFVKQWLFIWNRNDWKKSDKKPVENRDLWETIYALSMQHRISMHKVKGHSNDELNERCDKLAKDAILGMNKEDPAADH